MALVKCIECDHEISTEAKTCPNCGARNRAYKSKTGRVILLIILLGVLGFVSYMQITVGDYLTDCNTPSKRDSFARVIDGSSFAQLKKLRVIDITDIKTLESGESITDLVCEATISFNNLDTARYKFTWERSENGKLLITVTPSK